MTTVYSLWDVPSSTLLAETTSASEITAITNHFLHDNGEEALDELLLGISTPSSGLPNQFTGTDILRALKNEKVVHTTA